MLTKTADPNNSSVALRLSGVSSVFSNRLSCHQFHCKQNEKFSFFCFLCAHCVCTPNSAYWNAEPAGPLKCHGSDTETDEFAICQAGQLLPPHPTLKPPGKPLETSSPATKDKGLRGSWFLITGLPSSEYHSNRLFPCVQLKWREMRSVCGRQVCQQRGVVSLLHPAVSLCYD